MDFQKIIRYLGEKHRGKLAMKIKIQVFLLFLLTFAQSTSFSNDEDINENPLTIQPRAANTTVTKGDSFRLTVDMRLPDGYRAYLKMFKLRVVDNTELQISPFNLEPIIVFDDKVSGEKKKGLSGSGAMTADVTVTEKHEAGVHSARFELTYQACREDLCLFPKKIPFEIEYVVVDGTSSTVSTPGESSFTNAMSKGTWYAFLFVFFAGLLTSLTPCVFPMIPITLSILGTRTVGQSRFKSFLLSICYVIGIGITYSILGVVAAKTGALFGSALANPWVIGVIAILFVSMGLSMYGVFEIQVPAFIRNRLGNKDTGTGFFGAFLSGLVAGIVASPCIGPVLVGVLTYVAQTQDVILGFLLLFTFALGLGVLFIVLGTFSQLLNKVPKAGGWMDGVKFVFGTTMIGMAFFYLKPALPHREFFGLLGLACILISSAFGAFRAYEPTPPQQIKKGLLVTIFVVGLACILSAIFEREVREFKQAATRSNQNSEDTSAKTTGMIWKPYSDALFNEALSNRKPIIIDFYADWCSACKELDRYTFTDVRVQLESDKFVLLKVDNTVETDESSRLKSYFKVVGLPTVLFYDGTGKLRNDLTLTGFENAANSSTWKGSETGPQQCCSPV